MTTQQPKGHTEKGGRGGGGGGSSSGNCSVFVHGLSTRDSISFINRPEGKVFVVVALLSTGFKPLLEATQPTPPLLQPFRR